MVVDIMEVGYVGLFGLDERGKPLSRLPRKQHPAAGLAFVEPGRRVLEFDPGDKIGRIRRRNISGMGHRKMDDLVAFFFEEGGFLKKRSLRPSSREEIFVDEKDFHFKGRS